MKSHNGAGFFMSTKIFKFDFCHVLFYFCHVIVMLLYLTANNVNKPLKALLSFMSLLS